MKPQKELPALEPRLKSLRAWNWAMAVLHAVQGSIMLAVSSDFALPVTSAFLKFDPVSRRLNSLLDTLTTFKIGPLVAGFLFLSALFHLINALGFSTYVRNLMKNINPSRWIEYSLSATLMLVVIAMLVGIYDIASLILLFFLGVMMNLCGWAMEAHNQTTKKTSWLTFWFGCIAGFGPWLAIAIYLFGAYSAPPPFVYWIYFSIFIFFNCFAINMVLQYKKVGKWQDYLYGERVYMILSLVAKSLLAWQVFAGTLRPA
ncbi:MAG: heliorhodopsin HeR [Candidatus Kerfeldbacteria bacterium]|nr:heliorhodopsin HeR [Candidatus Kerfeldbacteria bacterium]